MTRSTIRMGLAVCAAAVAGAAPAMVTKTTAAGTVDTRLVRSADAVAAVADTRRPIAKIADKMPCRGLLLIVR